MTEISKIEDALATLPELNEQLRRFAAAGLDEKLKEKASIDREGRLFEDADKMVMEAGNLAYDVLAKSTVDHAIVGDDAKDLPNGRIVVKLVQSSLSHRT